MSPHQYTKRGGFWSHIITLRGEVCGAVSLHKEGGLCNRIIKLRGEVCGAALLH